MNLRQSDFETTTTGHQPGSSLPTPGESLDRDFASKTKLNNEPDQLQTHDFLVEAATMLHKYGTPAYRLERVMSGVAESMGVDADFLYTPTSLLVSFKQGAHRTRLERIEPSGPELGKLIELDSTLEEVEAHQLDSEAALNRLKQIDESPSRFGFFAVLMASVVGSACATVFLGGGVAEALYAAVVGAMIQIWGAVLKRYFPQEHLLEISAGFFSAAASIGVGQLFHAFQWTPFDQGTACLGSLIILVPGFTFTVALAELANRHLVCGVARLAGAAVVFLALVCGVALAWRLGAVWRMAPPTDGNWMPTWAYFGSIAIAPFSFAILFQARVKDWPIIVSVAWVGFFTTLLATQWQGNEFGAFVGAMALGAVANLYAKIFDRPTSVAQMPGTLMLVPGSLGYRSLTAFVEKQGVLGIESAFTMSMIAISIVGGLLASNLIVPPRRIL